MNVRPIADLENLDIVQVLTSSSGSPAARISALAAALPPGRSGGEANGEQLASLGGGG